LVAKFARKRAEREAAFKKMQAEVMLADVIDEEMLATELLKRTHVKNNFIHQPRASIHSRPGSTSLSKSFRSHEVNRQDTFSKVQPRREEQIPVWPSSKLKSYTFRSHVVEQKVVSLGSKMDSNFAVENCVVNEEIAPVVCKAYSNIIDYNGDVKTMVSSQSELDSSIIINNFANELSPIIGNISTDPNQGYAFYEVVSLPQFKVASHFADSSVAGKAVDLSKSELDSSIFESGAAKGCGVPPKSNYEKMVTSKSKSDSNIVESNADEFGISYVMLTQTVSENDVLTKSNVYENVVLSKSELDSNIVGGRNLATPKVLSNSNANVQVVEASVGIEAIILPHFNVVGSTSANELVVSKSKLAGSKQKRSRLEFGVKEHNVAAKENENVHENVTSSDFKVDSCVTCQKFKLGSPITGSSHVDQLVESKLNSRAFGVIITKKIVPLKSRSWVDPSMCDVLERKAEEQKPKVARIEITGPVDDQVDASFSEDCRVPFCKVELHAIWHQDEFEFGKMPLEGVG